MTQIEVTLFSAQADQPEAIALQNALVANGVPAKMYHDGEPPTAHHMLLCSAKTKDDFLLSQALKTYSGSPILIIGLEEKEHELTAESLPHVLRSIRDGESGNLRSISPPDFFGVFNKSPFEADRIAWLIRDELGIEAQGTHPPTISKRVPWIATAAAVTIAISGGVFGMAQYEANRALDAALAQSNDFSNEMLLYMAQTLPDEVGANVLNDMGARALALFEATPQQSLDDEGLVTRARILHFIAEARDANGDVEGAQEAFTLAHALTATYLSREPNNEARRFAHSQSAFWVGASAYRRGNLPDAETAFSTYSKLVTELAHEFPENLTYQAETGHAAINNAAIYLETGAFEQAEEALEQALAGFNETVIEGGAASENDRANALAWLADARFSLGNFQEAIDARREEITLRIGQHAEESLSNFDKIRIANARYNLAQTLSVIGDSEGATNAIVSALSMISPVRDEQPDNVRTRQLYTSLMVAYAQSHRLAGRIASAKMIIDEASAQLIDDETGASDQRYRESAALAGESARIALAFGVLPRAEMEASRAIDALEERIETGYAASEGQLAAAHLLMHDIRLAAGDEGRAAASLRLAVNAIDNADQSQWDIIELAARIAWHEGNEAQARMVAANLEAQGYAHPEFTQFWRIAETANTAANSPQQEQSNDG